MSQLRLLHMVGLVGLLWHSPAMVLAHDYFPPPESQGGWRVLKDREEIRQRAGMNPAKAG